MTFKATCTLHETGLLEFTDFAALAEHMKTKHQRNPVRMPKRAGSGPAWKAPKLTAEGCPFEPTGMDPGAQITWTEYIEVGQDYDGELGRVVPRREKVERTGQVWSKAGANESVWVIPDKPLNVTELAVLVREQSYALPGEPPYTACGTYTSRRSWQVA